jgi:hypothetical protein
MRTTVKHLEAKVDIINTMLGHGDAPEWNTVGAVRLYRAYGATGVHRVMSTSGAVEALSELGTMSAELGTMSEARQFLSGMIAALRIAAE